MSIKKPKATATRIESFSAKALSQLSQLFAAPAVITARNAVVAPTLDRFAKVSAAGVLLPKSATDWEGVYDAEQNLVFGRRLLPGTANWKDSVAKADAATLCGKPARAPTTRQRFNISDLTRRDPALDTDYFEREEGYEWTRDVFVNADSSPSVSAWFVFLGVGSVYWCFQSYHCGVRAVCAGQV